MSAKPRGRRSCQGRLIALGPLVHWRFVGSSTEVLDVKDPSTKVAKCVEGVMATVPATVPATMEAECYATLLIGDPDGARAAAEG